MIPTFEEFFETALGFSPYPYQIQLSEGRWPELLHVPTGLGKTVRNLIIGGKQYG